MKPTIAPFSTSGAALLGESPNTSISWGQSLLVITNYGTFIPLHESQARALRDHLNRLMPPESNIQTLITKIRVMQDTNATQCNPSGPERARFDALSDVIVMLEELA